MDRVHKGVTSALLIATVYSIASALILPIFADVAVMSLFLDTTTEVEIVAMGREYLFWNSVFSLPLGALIVWRQHPGPGFSTLAMMAGVAEMIARTAVAIVLVPMLWATLAPSWRTRRLDRGLHLPVPGLPLDLPPVGQPPAGRPPAYSERKPGTRSCPYKANAD